ncbi:protoheme IX farnesyltransferase [Parvularcula sp. LCG005]|uniref:protoheme IX farnesyltransferase n=1 Tax=Parvularcula sp. LCG005 TaxID=3078805 RepID=UPI0029438BFA|nr:protoheme IX farnesyltransferase [Parvularcula sp. LCG005]WOI53979.1 protoheme IX farnesyltransferase [Parvularcula sp. LCG005]
MAEHDKDDHYQVPGEGVPTGESYEMTPEEKKARARRNIAIAVGVLAFVVIVYSTTLLRMTQNMGGAAG